MLDRCGGSGSLGWCEAGEVAFLLFVSWIAADPCEYLTVLRENRIDDVASQTEAAFVIAPVQRQDAAAPLLQRLIRIPRNNLARQTSEVSKTSEVLARVTAQLSLVMRIRRKAGVVANVTRGGGRHGRDIDDELFVAVEHRQVTDS